MVAFAAKRLSLTAVTLYYATQFQEFKTDSLKSFSIKCSGEILNNGSKRTMLMTLAKPGLLQGSLNFNLNTQFFPASNTMC